MSGSCGAELGKRRVCGERFFDGINLPNDLPQNSCILLFLNKFTTDNALGNA